MVRPRFVALLSLSVSLALVPLARGADWAAGVLNYAAGLTYPSPDPTDVNFIPPTGGVDQAYAGAAPGQLSGITADTGFGVLTPFNGPFAASQYVGIGQGGSITLQFQTPVSTSGYTIGIHTASGLIDFDYPNGNAGAVTTPYTTPRRALVEVSAIGTDWVALGTFDLNNPTNYYATGVDTPGYQAADAAGAIADVNKPFLGSVSSFDGENWPQMLATLDGSAGGTWLDLTPAGIASVDYVRFSVPTGSVLYLDGVVGLPAPEPVSLGLLGLGVIPFLMRRRRNA